MIKQSRLALVLTSMVLSLGVAAAPTAFAASTSPTKQAQAKHHKTHKVNKDHKAHAKKAAPQAKAK